MSRIDAALLQSNERIDLPAPDGCTISHGEHGLEAVTIQYALNRFRAFSLLNRASAAVAARVTGGGTTVADARVEDIAITDTGATVQALGRWRVLRDAPYTALWSDTRTERWRVLTAQDRAARTSQRYVFDQVDSGALVVALKQGMAYSNQTIGSYGYEAPSNGARSIAGIQFALEYNLPATYRLRVIRYSGGFGGAATVVNTFNGTGTLERTANFSNWSPNACDAIELALDYNSAAAGPAYAGQDGDNYALITGLRVVSAVENALTGTLGTAVAAPGSVVVTPSGGTNRIYVGQQIVIIGTNSEIVTVTAVTSTTFTATFTATHPSTDLIRSFVVYADEVARGARDFANTVNAGALSTSNALIQSPGLDLLDQVYEDADAGDVLTSLAALGGSDGTRYEVGVEGSALYFRPAGSAAQAWYVDATSLEVQQTLDQLYNSVYARYEAASGRTLRTAAQADSTSIARYGLTRRRAVDASTTSAAVAARVAQTSRDDTKNPVPRAALAFTRIYTASGAQAPLWLVRAGDTITIRNLPPVAGGAVDLIRTFRVFDCAYDAGGDSLSVTPETPLPLLEYLLARQTAFGDIAAGRLVR